MTLISEAEKREIVREQVNEYWDDLHPEKLAYQERLDKLVEDYIVPATDGQINPAVAQRMAEAVIHEDD